MQRESIEELDIRYCVLDIASPAVAFARHSFSEGGGYLDIKILGYFLLRIVTL